jgi:hypothetical protein
MLAWSEHQGRVDNVVHAVRPTIPAIASAHLFSARTTSTLPSALSTATTGRRLS